MTQDQDRPHEPKAAPPAPAPATDDPMVGFAPTRLVVGFGVLASLILLLVRRRRRP
jgi:hypothetical protein